MINTKTIVKYCKEDASLIENYDRAINDDKMWDCHHRLETHDEQGNIRQEALTIEDLKAQDLYYDRPADELIFMTRSEHMALHRKGCKYWLGKHFSKEHKDKLSKGRRGKRHTEETKQRMSERHKGKTTWNKGKHLSEEHKKRISEAIRRKTNNL